VATLCPVLDSLSYESADECTCRSLNAKALDSRLRGNDGFQVRRVLPDGVMADVLTRTG
jgi:hypothetical protein